MDRHSAVDESFSFSNTGAGAMTLDIEGTLAADGLDCPDCVTSASIENLSITGADLANGSVSGAKIATAAVYENHITSGAITTTKIADNAVAAPKLATNSVTSVKIANGTITPDDVDQTKGFYVSKSQLYERETSQTWEGPGGLVQGVNCDDANDLPLAGSCRTSSANVRLYSTSAENWTNPTAPASWECRHYNTMAGSAAAYATILCIAVP
jgi:hypothetical protein